MNINVAIQEFMRDQVNLDPTQTGLARTSRNWLIDQIRSFPQKDDTFPRPYQEVDVLLGSFHRRTKVRPLDDVDLIFGLSAEGSTYGTSGSQIVLYAHQESRRLLSLCHDGTQQVNSRKILNRFVMALSNVPQYRRAEIGRDGEAAVVSLSSYTWSFDVVPAFFTKPESDGRQYYLIPDGQGHWKRTDPRIDDLRIATQDRRHGGVVLPCIRLLKYWNKRRTVPTVRSYAFESIILSHYESLASAATTYIDLECRNVLNTLASSIYLPIPDPKGIQGDLNTLSITERMELSTRANVDVNLIDEALRAEQSGDHQTAIARWRQVMGPDFPAYG